VSDKDSHIEYGPNGHATGFYGPDAVALYAAATLVSAMRLYAKHRIKVNRAYTPTAMLRRAGEICGKTYKRNQMLLAADDVAKWVQTMKAALPAVEQQR
jgi:hypothetical protein